MKQFERYIKKVEKLVGEAGDLIPEIDAQDHMWIKEEEYYNELCSEYNLLIDRIQQYEKIMKRANFNAYKKALKYYLA